MFFLVRMALCVSGLNHSFPANEFNIRIQVELDWPQTLSRDPCRANRKRSPASMNSALKLRVQSEISDMLMGSLIEKFIFGWVQVADGPLFRLKIGESCTRKNGWFFSWQEASYVTWVMNSSSGRNASPMLIFDGPTKRKCPECPPASMDFPSNGQLFQH